MSGHSHAKTIKHQKNLTDQKRGQLFSKMARVISIAVKEGGPNPETNSRLQAVIEDAKSKNMPKDNIERAIQNAQGAGADENFEEVSYEAYGPGGVAVIIDGITDNTNRTLGDMKQIMNQHGGKLVGEGAVRWMFERKGYIVIDPKAQAENFQNKETLEMAIIEAGADDIKWADEILEVYTKTTNLNEVKKSLEAQGIKADSAAFDWIAKEEVSVDERDREACQKLFDALDENDAVQNVASNLKD
jgi:YebC/PmpR family DNA-binding regulatory protein